MFLKIQSFYNKWLIVRDDYLKTPESLEKEKIAINDTDDIREYEQTLEEGLSLEGNAEYNLYYNVRELIGDLW